MRCSWHEADQISVNSSRQATYQMTLFLWTSITSDNAAGAFCKAETRNANSACIRNCTSKRWRVPPLHKKCLLFLAFPTRQVLKFGLWPVMADYLSAGAGDNKQNWTDTEVHCARISMSRNAAWCVYGRILVMIVDDKSCWREWECDETDTEICQNQSMFEQFNFKITN